MAMIFQTKYTDLMRPILWECGHPLLLSLSISLSMQTSKLGLTTFFLLEIYGMLNALIYFIYISLWTIEYNATRIRILRDQ